MALVKSGDLDWSDTMGMRDVFLSQDIIKPVRARIVIRSSPHSVVATGEGFSCSCGIIDADSSSCDHRRDVVASGEDAKFFHPYFDVALLASPHFVVDVGFPVLVCLVPYRGDDLCEVYLRITHNGSGTYIGLMTRNEGRLALAGLVTSYFETVVDREDSGEPVCSSPSHNFKIRALFATRTDLWKEERRIIHVYGKCSLCMRRIKKAEDLSDIPF